MTTWTTPPTFMDDEIVYAAELNIIRDDLNHLNAAKDCILGILALSVPDDTWTDLEWQFAAEETAEMWSVSGYPERISPQTPGLYLVQLSVAFEDDTDSGTRKCAIVKNGTTTTQVDTRGNISGNTMYTSCSHVIRLNGTTDYLNTLCYQNSGGALGLKNTAPVTNLSVVWLGA